VYFAYFAMDGEAVESCPFSSDQAHEMVVEQGIIIMDRITGYALGYCEGKIVFSS
jgi:hypothetical protein